MVGLGHEGDRAPGLVGHLLDPVLVDHVVVGHGHRVGETEVDLLLAGPRLTLGAFHRDARALHALADRTQESLVIRGGEDVVVEDVRHRGRQVGVVLGVRLGERLLEEEELELGTEHGLEAERAGALDLGAKDLPRRGPNRLAVVPGHVAKDERGGLEPGDAAQRRKVGHHVEVAVAALPVGHLVAGDGIHLHVERQQVVAPLDRLPVAGGVHEVLGVEALAHQPALHVGEGDDDGVDLTLFDLSRELVLAESGPALAMSGLVRLVSGQHLDTSRVPLKKSAGERSRAPTSLRAIERS